MSNDDLPEREEKALRDFLEGRSTAQELHRALAHFARFDLASEGYRSMELSDPFSCEVGVELPRVIQRLESYLEGSLSAEELTLWATHLTLIDAYVTPGWEDDELADRYEVMWDVLQELSTPAIDGEIDEQRVSGYLDRLETLRADPRDCSH